MLGLASDLPIKNCWTIAEHVGAARPGRTVCNTCWARWSGITTGVRSDLRGYVVEHLMIERSTMHLMNSSPVCISLPRLLGRFVPTLIIQCIFNPILLDQPRNSSHHGTCGADYGGIGAYL